MPPVLRTLAAFIAGAAAGAAMRKAAARRTSDIEPDPASPPEPATAPEPGAPPSSVLASRIALDLDGPPPTVAALGLEVTKSQAFEWQQRRGHLHFNDMHGYLSGRGGARWIAEVHGLLGVIAEQMLVSIEAESEKAICTNALAPTPAPGSSPGAEPLTASRRAHYSRSLRFFAEGQANAIVIACHGLANMVLRSIEFDEPLTGDELKTLRIGVAHFVPGTQAASAWISMNTSSLDALKAIADVRSSATQAMVAELRSIYDEKAVNSLIALRNVHYHRWRGETAGVTGFSRSAKTAKEVLESRQVYAVRAGAMLPDYAEGQVSLDEIVAASRAALEALTGHLATMHETWYAAFTNAFTPGAP